MARHRKRRRRKHARENPLPTWSWWAIGGAALVGVVLLARKASAATTPPATTPPQISPQRPPAKLTLSEGVWTSYSQAQTPIDMKVGDLVIIQTNLYPVISPPDLNNPGEPAVAVSQAAGAVSIYAKQPGQTVVTLSQQPGSYAGRAILIRVV